MLTARAFNRVYDLKLTVRGEMELAYQGEITTPSRCGRMDQGCAFGNRPVLMTFDGDRLDTQELQVKDDLHYRARGSAGAERHDGNPQPVEPLLSLRREQDRAWCAGAAGSDQQAHRPPGDGSTLHARRHAAGQPDERGAGLFRPVCRTRLPGGADLSGVAPCACLSAAAAHIYGGKGVGSQGDGTAQFLARSQADQQAVIEIIERDLGLQCLSLTLRPMQRVRKAVIPAAGFGRASSLPAKPPRRSSSRSSTGMGLPSRRFY